MRALPRFFPDWKIFVPAFWLAFFVWTGILMFASSQPGIPCPETPVIGIDKVMHFFFFASGAIALGAALRATFHMHWATVFLLVIVVLSLLGLADEVHQLFVVGRSGGDPFDWLADLTGTCGGLAVLRAFYAKRPRENPIAPPGN
ncbi:MAG: VanZ family protein [Terrimicrobiaceae bacterium]